MNIAAMLHAVPDDGRTAIVFSDSHITFHGLDELSARLAEGFSSHGLGLGDRAIVIAPISLNLYAALIALFRVGASAVFLDPQAGIGQLDDTARNLDPKALICSRQAQSLRILSGALRHIPHVFLTDGDGARSLRHLAKVSGPQTHIQEVADQHPALITYTGGSTDPGRPRAVIRTHGLLVAQHAALSRALPIAANDIDLPAFPIALLHNLAAGVTSVVPDYPFRRPSAVRPEKILRQIKLYAVTTASGSPAYWAPIAGFCQRRGLTLGLRRILTGGAPVSARLLRELKLVAPRAEIVSVYGSTEAEPVATLHSEELLEEANHNRTTEGAGVLLGRPTEDIRVRILDPDGVELGTASIGEIWVSGEHVSRGYLADARADATHKRLDANGRLWHRMGDIGYRDERGQLWLVGRINTVFSRAGVPVYSAQVEAAVGSLPFIQRAALVGIPDPGLGQRAVLLLERGDACPPDWQERIRDFCKARGWSIDEVRAARRLAVDARHNARLDYQRLRSGISRS